MKVLIHNVAGGYGGAERTLEQLIPYLQPEMEIWVAAQNEHFIEMLQQISATVPITVIRPISGRSPLDILVSTARTLHLCWMQRFDHVIVNSNKSAMIFALCNKLLPRRTRIMVFIRDFQWTAARFIFAALGARASYYAPSEAVKELWPKRYGYLKGVSIIPSSFQLPNEALQVIPDCHEPTFSQGSRPSQRHFLVLGTVSALKGIDTAILALAKIADDYPDVILRIVGAVADESVLRGLKDLVRENGLDHRVEFFSHRDDVKQTILDSICMVSATVPWNGGPETFGRTIIESWALMRSVIASRCGGPKYIVEDGVDGLLFEPGNADELAGAFRRILDDPTFMWKMAENGHTKFMRQFTTEMVAKKLIDALLKT